MNVPDPYAEQRSNPRAPIGVIVHVKTNEAGRHFYSKNISAGGVFLLADSPLPVETQVTMEIFLPLVNTPIRVTGEVVWIQKNPASGFAVRFLDVSPAGQNLIRWVVDRYLNRTPDR